jgi:molybdate transport system ATP-binding protein
MDSVGLAVTPKTLSAQVRFERPNDGASRFFLDVALEIPPGFTILFGPSGAGKSTLLDCIAGLLKPASGRIAVGSTVLFDAARGVNLPPQERRLGYVFQSLALFPHLSAEENVAYGLHKLDSAERRLRTERILAAFHLEKLRTQKPDELSGGEKQRVALARSLVTEPRALLLDEPLTGLDAGLKSAILDDLRAWNAEARIPILCVTHSRDEVDALGERVVALDRGRVVSEGAPLEVLEAPRKPRLAQIAGFENLLEGTVLDLRESDGVMRIALAQGGAELEVPLGCAAPGDRVRIAIRAGDILLAAEKPDRLSARNLLHGRIANLQERGALCWAKVDCGAEFQVHVTRGAARELALAPGAAIWLIVKTHSCHVVRD